MSLSGDKGVAQFKKSVKMGHPNGEDTPAIALYLQTDSVPGVFESFPYVSSR